MSTTKSRQTTKESRKQLLLDETLDVMAAALKERRVIGKKFVVLDTRAAFVEIRIKVEEGWTDALNKTLRATNMQHRIYGFALAELHRFSDKGDCVAVTYNPDYNRYDQGLCDHLLYETRRGIIDRTPVSELSGADATVVVDVLDGVKNARGV